MMEKNSERDQGEKVLQQLTLRNQIGDLFLKIPDKDLYGEILNLLKGALTSKYGLFGYLDEKGVLVFPQSAQIVDDSEILNKGAIRLPRDEWTGIWGQALQEKRTMSLNKPLREILFPQIISRIIVAPIMYGSNVIGLLLLANKETDYTKEDENLLEVISWDLAPILSARLEQERYRENLEEIVSQRTVELKTTIQHLEKARETAEIASKTKTEFLANMSHELKTPLNAMIGFSEILADDIPGPTNFDQKRLLQDIIRSGQHLLELISDILDVTKIETGKEERKWEEFSLSQTLKECLETLERPQNNREIQIELLFSLKSDIIISNKVRFIQVLKKLLENALKFTPEGKRVGIEVIEMLDVYEIIIWDEGIGMDFADIKRLFQPFQQLENPFSKKYAGTGLGLYIVKKLVTYLKGTITVKSKINEGSKFRIVLPKN